MTGNLHPRFGDIQNHTAPHSILGVLRELGQLIVS